MKMLKLKPGDMVLGDQVRCFDGPYGWGTVVNITDDEVHIFRPFTHIGDFTYTGGVLHYTGHELVKLFRDGKREREVDAYTHEQMSKPGALR